MKTETQGKTPDGSPALAPVIGSEYPNLTHMSTYHLAMMLRQAAEYPEDAEFAKAIAKEIARRKPSLGVPNADVSNRRDNPNR